MPGTFAPPSGAALETACSTPDENLCTVAEERGDATVAATFFEV